MKEVAVGLSVIYMNEVRQELPALVTAVHGNTVYDSEGKLVHAPCINLVIVSTDWSKKRYLWSTN